MANDDPERLLPVAGDPPPLVPPVPGRARLTCEHCGCRLAPNGDVMEVSDKARGHIRHAEILAKRDEQIADLESKLRDATTKIAELQSKLGDGSKRSPLDLKFGD